MPRLQILHHKSYHPYLEKNKQRVREDEAKAAAEELALEQSRIDAASSSRLDELRRRAGSPSFRPSAGAHEDDAGDLPSTSSARNGESGGSSLMERHKKEKARLEKREKKAKERLDFDFPSESAKREERRQVKKAGMAGMASGSGGAGGIGAVDRDDMWIDGAGQGDQSSAWDSGGHINLFADVEKDENDRPQLSLAELAKNAKAKESDIFTMYLGRPAKETQPWYADRELRRYEDKAVGEEAEERRARDKRKDVRSKARHDPLTQIEGMLKPKSASASASAMPAARRSAGTGTGTGTVDAVSARETREKAERQRALDLIARTKAQAARSAAGNGNRWDDTPSTVAGGRSWAEDFEREKDKAGMRFFGNGTGGKDRGWAPDRRTGRSWEV